MEMTRGHYDSYASLAESAGHVTRMHVSTFPWSWGKKCGAPTHAREGLLWSQNCLSDINFSFVIKPDYVVTSSLFDEWTTPSRRLRLLRRQEKERGGRMSGRDGRSGDGVRSQRGRVRAWPLLIIVIKGLPGH
ncbi:hypothetical protein CEXT_314031 [Caerostris extrusa]|uniref:Uncharacterized protein n=1 Tax=Caerostris extrusa TaxID=172846 RepID=A0AAV4PCC9_CAEEX|nr:hypothetical protein CEXT_314031 [Caerostris extrusa]